MLDLVILLSIALAVTALLGLLLVGFVWMPWLVGVLLVALLLALIKFSVDEPEPDLSELDLGNGSGEASRVASRLGQAQSSPQATSHRAASQAVAQSAQNSAPVGDSAAEPAPRMVYRGVKYQRPKATADSSSQKGLYRGQPWQR
jgi:hypothetical protein